MSVLEKGAHLCVFRAKVVWGSTRCRYPKPSEFAISSQFPSAPSSSIDPCVGDGVAFEVITSGAEVLRYGIELDACRAEQAKQRIPNIVQGSRPQWLGPLEPGQQFFRVGKDDLEEGNRQEISDETSAIRAGRHLMRIILKVSSSPRRDRPIGLRGPGENECSAYSK